MFTKFINRNSGEFFDGENVRKIYFYDSGRIMGEAEEIKEHTIKDGNIESVYNGTREAVYIDFEIKKAIKLNLNRRDAFYYKNTEKHYSFDKPYNLYIHVSLLNFENIGEFIGMKSKDETCYLQAYKIILPEASFERLQAEKITDENYRLKDNEYFTGDGFIYGTDKRHAAIYQASGSPLFSERHPEIKYIRKYYEIETLKNHEIIITKLGYTRIEYSEQRKNNRLLADELKKAGFKYSWHDIERLAEAGFKISKI